MKKQITTLTLLSALLFFASCQKKENNDDENFLTAALILASNASNCGLEAGSSTVTLPFVTATTTAQEVKFTTSNGVSLGIVIAKNLQIGQKIVFTGSSTATAYSDTVCPITVSTTTATNSGSPSFSQTSTNPPSFTALKTNSEAGVVVSGNGGTVTVQIQ